jgi:hypothetical protein
MLDDPVPLKGGAVQKAQGADGLVEAAPRDLLLLDQIQLVSADLLRSELFRGPMEVTGEQRDAFDVRLLGLHGVIA